MEIIVVREMLDNQLPRLRHRWSGQMLTRRKKVGDFAEYPRTTLRCTSDHQRIGAGMQQHPPGVLWRGNVAVCDHGNCDGALDRGNRVVFHGAHECACAGASMNSQRGDTGVLRVRMALHCGPATEREGDYYGATLNRAARLMALAHGGQIVASEAVALLVRDEPSHLRGITHVVTRGDSW